MRTYGQLPAVQQPIGFAGVRREERSAYADSRAFYVDPNNTLSSDSNSGEDPAYPLLTIARAVVLARALKGDTIYVIQNDGWQHGSATNNDIVESVTIPAAKPGLSLIGVGFGSIGVYWEPAAALGTCLTILAIDTYIEGFTFWGNAAQADGIYAEWDGATLFGDNITIRNCTFETTIDTAIELEFSWYNIIEGCLFSECAVVGIASAVGGSGCAFNRIYNNDFLECLGTGAMSLLGGADNNHIWGNRIFNSEAQGGALATLEGIDLTGGDENLVADNYFSCLLPVPANGDWDDLNTAAAGDAWVGNHCMNGLAVSNPT